MKQHLVCNRHPSTEEEVYRPSAGMHVARDSESRRTPPLAYVTVGACSEGGAARLTADVHSIRLVVNERRTQTHSHFDSRTHRNV